MTRNWLSGLGIVTLLTAALLSTGCGRSTRSRTVEIEGIKLPPKYAATVEVDNFNGSVHVQSDPEATEAQVSAKVRNTSPNGPAAGLLDRAVVIKAVSSIEGPERLLRVSARAADEPPQDVAVDLYIRIPKLSATRIRNAGGPVELVGISGAVTVENGAGGKPGGDVQLRTGEAMTEPARILTTSGRVLWQVGAGSSGKFDLVSDSGQAVFLCKLGEVSDVIPDPSHYRGTLNKGSNAISLRSGAGPVQASVIENAATYGPDVWDGGLSWPTKPRFIGRLGGYYNDEPARLFGKPSGTTTPAPAPAK